MIDWVKGNKPTSDGMYYVKFRTLAFTDSFSMKQYFDIMTIPYTVKNGWCTYSNDGYKNDSAAWENIEAYAKAEEVNDDKSVRK